MSCYVIILNYKTWKDTVECLDSVFQSRNVPIKVIVCDNLSQNRSLEHIAEWADGKLEVTDVNPKPFLSKHLVERPQYLCWDKPRDDQYDTPLLLVNTQANYGFAAGNNDGIRIAMNQSDCESMFVLNNDTVIMPDTIEEAVKVLRQNPKAGICSTNVKYYFEPNKPAWKKMYFYPLLGEEKSEKPADETKAISRYTGMAFFVKPDFVKKVGFMYERYFLYYEELDWAYRSKFLFDSVMADRSVVYHKESVTAKPDSKLRSFCFLRSKFLFMKQHYPGYYWIVYFSWWLRVVKRLLFGNIHGAVALCRFMFMFTLKGENYTGRLFRLKSDNGSGK